MPGTLLVSLDVPAVELYTTAGILRRDAGGQPVIPRHLKLFVTQSEQALEKVRGLAASGEMSMDDAARFRQLLVDTCAHVMFHPIVASNRYLERFAEGVTFAQARHELQQFSVFALQFDVAQAKLVANAPSLEAYEERLNVLLNEKGIPFREGFEGDLTGQWNPQTVHFTWLRNMAEGLNLKFEELGKIWIGQPGTVAFVNATFNTYASTDQNMALGASFGIENWAANNLWKPWITGMKKLNASLPTRVNLGYLTYHDAEEEHHSQATLDELLENFCEPWFDGEKFLAGADTILTEGVQAYYVSQLATLPEKDASWPSEAVAPREFDPATIGRV